MDCTEQTFEPIIAASSGPEQYGMYWHSERRYYAAVAQRDLFGHWECMRYWGGQGSRLGGSMSVPANDLAHALVQVREVGRQRARRGYKPVTTGWGMFGGALPMDPQSI
jgi:hypothetical protein